MENITELRNNLADLFEQIRTDAIDVKHAAEMNNTAGKIIASLKVELDYAEQRQVQPDIEFLNN